MTRLAVFCCLLATAWIVWLPLGPRARLDFRELEAALAGPLGLVPNRFDDSNLLPDDYLWLLAQREQPLISLYVGWYPRLGGSALGPHDPQVCYASQGWAVGAVQRIEVALDSTTAMIQAAMVSEPAGSLFVTWWSQPRGELPQDPGRVSWWDEMVQRWTTGRSDLAWVRLEWDPAAAEDLPRVAATAAQVMIAVRRAIEIRR